jgi:CubicO group peptidase (beta-lactamase class C family)
MRRLTCLIFFLLLFFYRCNQKNHVQTNEEQCFVAPPDAALDSIRNNIRAKQLYFEDYFYSLHRSGVFNGNILIAEKGKIIYMDSFGNANNRKKNKLEIEMTFQLASVSKIFTAVAILQLYEKGLLDLNDDVQKFIPEFPYENITVKHLLSHRSGLSRYEAFDQKQWDRTQPMTNENMIALFAKHKPNMYFKPGKRHDYSNTNFACLASIVERITKKSFKDYMHENIFMPSGMKKTYVFDVYNPPHPDSIALGHSRSYRLPLEPQQDYLNGVVGDKGVYSTVIDLYKFDVALYNNKLLQPETLLLAFERNNKNRRTPFDDYGFGHRLKDWRMNGQFIPFHSGWWRGFKTLFIRDIYEQKTIIMLSNQEISPQAQLIWNTLSL